jgi:hypothetical protein
MTLWKQGSIRCSRSCPASDHFLNPPASASAALLPIGTALVTEFAPRRIRATMIVMGVVGVALGGGLAGLVAAQFMSIYGSRARPTRPRRRCPEQTEPLAPRCACPPTSPISFSRIRLRGANDGEAAAAPCRPTRPSSGNATLRHHPDPHRKPLVTQATVTSIVVCQREGGADAL